MVGVPALCLCSLTIGLSDKSASLNVFLTNQVNITVAKKVIKNIIIIFVKSIFITLINHTEFLKNIKKFIYIIIFYSYPNIYIFIYI